MALLLITALLLGGVATRWWAAIKPSKVAGSAVPTGAPGREPDPLDSRAGGAPQQG